MSRFSLRSAWSARYGRPFFVLLVLNALVLLCFTLPRSVTERRLATEAVSLRQEIDEQRRVSAEVQKQVATIDGNVRQTHRFYTELISSRDELPKILEDLDSMATKQGLRVTHTGYQQADVKGTKLTSISITMPVSGGYEQIGRFLQDLERAPFFLVVNQVQMRGRSVDGGVDLDITMEAFFRSEKPAEKTRSS